MVRALGVLFAGAVSPLSLSRLQKDEPKLVRHDVASVGVDATAHDAETVSRLLAKAKEMAAAGLIST